MKNLKKVKQLIALVVVVSMMLTIVGTINVSAAPNDYVGHWAEKEITYLIDQGIVSGDGKNINPEGMLTRAEFVKIVNRSNGFVNKASESFPDISSSDWFYHEFLIAKNEGYITGDEKGNANPNQNITRAEASVIIARILKLDISDVNGNFTDGNEIPSWAIGSVIALNKAGIIMGYKDGSFKSENNITRAEGFVITKRVMDKIGYEKPTSTPPVPTYNPGGGGTTVSGGGGGGTSSSAKALATPSNVTISVNDDKITGSWSSVLNAGHYNISVKKGNSQIGYIKDNVGTDVDLTSYFRTYDGGAYSIGVVAVSTSPKYKNSNEGRSKSLEKLMTPSKFHFVSQYQVSFESVSNGESYLLVIEENSTPIKEILLEDAGIIDISNLYGTILKPDKKYTVKVKAIAEETKPILDSNYSERLVLLTNDQTPPDPVSNLVVRQDSTSITVSWIDPQNEDLSHIEIELYNNSKLVGEIVQKGVQTYTFNDLAVGDYVVKITAQDTAGLKSEIQTKSVKIVGVNNPPTVANKVSNKIATKGTEFSVDLSNVFNDPDGDVLTITSSIGKITSDVFKHTFTEEGAFSVILSAKDSKGGTVKSSFVVAVGTVSAPTVVVKEPMENTTVDKGSSVTIDLSENFEIYNSASGSIEYSYSINNGETVTTTNPIITVPTEVVGEYSISISAKVQGTSNVVEEKFELKVVDVKNNPPSAGTINDMNVLLGASTTPINLSDLFTDLDGDQLKYYEKINSGEEKLISQSIYTFMPTELIPYNIMLIAKDGKGGKAVCSFKITVIKSEISEITEFNVTPVYVAPEKYTVSFNVTGSVKTEISITPKNGQEKLINVTDVSSYDLMVGTDILEGTEYTVKVKATNGIENKVTSDYKITDISYGGGTGVVEDPYLIYNARHFNNIRNNSSLNYKLMADIDLGNAYDPIPNFTGTLKSDLKAGETTRKVTLNIHSPGTLLDGFVGNEGTTSSPSYHPNRDAFLAEASAGFGLFKKIDGAKIYNIATYGSIAGTTSVGAISGHAIGEFLIQNCENYAVVKSAFKENRSGNQGVYADVGGFVGVAGTSSGTNKGLIEGSTNYGNVHSSSARGIAGIVGRLNKPNLVNNCANKGNIDSYGRGYAGIAGVCYGKISNSYNQGTIEGLANISSWGAGIASLTDSDTSDSEANSSTIENCYNVGEIKSNGGAMLGGIVGTVNKKSVVINNCYNTGNITISNANAQAGGIIGNVGASPLTNATEIKITNCYNIGEISIAENARQNGVIGSEYTTITSLLDSTINNCYYSFPNKDDQLAKTIQKTLVEIKGLSGALGSSWALNPEGGDALYPYPQIKSNPHKPNYVLPGNNVPTVAKPIDAKVAVAGTEIEVDFTGVFADSDGDTLEYSATVSPTNDVVITGTKLKATFATEGTYIVTLKADDKKGGTVETTFNVAVAAKDSVTPPVISLEYSNDTYNIAFEKESGVTYDIYVYQDVNRPTTPTATNISSPYDITSVVLPTPSGGVYNVVVEGKKGDKKAESPVHTLNSKYAGGDGTDLNPYVIFLPRHLQNIPNGSTDSFVVSATNITLPTSYTPISFGGKFIGSIKTSLGEEIKETDEIPEINLTLNLPEQTGVGLFKELTGTAVVKKIKTTGMVIGKDKVGGIAGSTEGTKAGAEISNCYNEANVTGTAGNIGGIIGASPTSSVVNITNVHNKGNIKAEGTWCGGIAGHSGANISFASNTGIITGSSSTGGIVGQSYCEVKNSFNTGKVIGTTSSGGVVGSARYKKNTIENCYNAGEVIGTGVGVSSGGVLIGGITSGGTTHATSGLTIKNCYNVGIVKDLIDDTFNPIFKHIGGTDGNVIENNYYEGSFDDNKDNTFEKTKAELINLSGALGTAFEKSTNQYVYPQLVGNINGNAYVEPIVLKNVENLVCENGNGSVKLKWVNPADKNYDEIEIYVDNVLVHTINNNTEIEYVVSSLTNGTTYNFKVVTKKGTEKSSGATASGTPEAVTSPTVSISNPTKVLNKDTASYASEIAEGDFVTTNLPTSTITLVKGATTPNATIKYELVTGNEYPLTGLMAYVKDGTNYKDILRTSFDMTLADNTNTVYLIGANAGTYSAKIQIKDTISSAVLAQSSAITIKVNTPPTAAVMTDKTVEFGSNLTLNFADIFSDNDGDTLTYKAKIGTNDEYNVSGTQFTYSHPERGTVLIKLTATDTDGAEVAVTFNASFNDTTPTSKVSGLLATSGDGKINLSWTNPTDTDFSNNLLTVKNGITTIEGYNQLDVAKVTSKEITGLTNGTTYTFEIVSVDGSGNKSVAASTTGTPVSATQPPSKATNLAVVFTTDGELINEGEKWTLNWDAASNATSYEVCVTPDGQDAITKIVSTNSADISTQLRAGGEFSITVTSKNGGLSAATSDLYSINSDFAGGDGGTATPYKVASLRMLNNVHKNKSGNYLQIANIDTKDNFASIFRQGTQGAFTGTYKGELGQNGELKEIKLNITSAIRYSSVFGSLQNATVENIKTTGIVTLDEAGFASPTVYKEIAGISGTSAGNNTIKNCENAANVTGTTTTAGIIAVTNETDQIINCKNTGTISSDYEHIGGIAAYVNKPTAVIDNCENTGNITGLKNVGGIAGYSLGLIKNSKNSGTITANLVVAAAADIPAAGGIAGHVTTGGEINNCVNEQSGVVIAESHNGGIVGYLVSQAKDFTNCTNKGTVKNTHSGAIQVYTGGVIGYLRASKSVTNCLNDTTAFVEITKSNTGTGRYLAGIAGYVYTGMPISDCINKGTFKSVNSSTPASKEYAGGIAGLNIGMISKCYNQAYLKEVRNMGGIVGNNTMVTNGVTPTISECYNTGRIFTAGYGGGIAAQNTASDSYPTSVPTIINCYNIGRADGANIGGISGSNTGSATVKAVIKNCYTVLMSNSTNSIATSKYSTGTIENCYYAGNYSVTETANGEQKTFTNLTDSSLASLPGFENTIWEVSAINETNKFPLVQLKNFKYYGEFDITSPSDVTNSTATPTADGATITWTKPSDLDLEKVEIYVGADKKGEVLATDPQTFTITGLTVGRTYTATLKAVDTSNNVSTGVDVIFTVESSVVVPSITGGTNIVMGTPEYLAINSSTTTSDVALNTLTFDFEGDTTRNIKTKYVEFDPNATGKGYKLVPVFANDTVLGRKTVAQMAADLEAKGYDVIAGVNADFFNMGTGSGYESNYAGVPQGMMMKDGEIICSQLENIDGTATRHGFGLTSSNELILTPFSQSSNQCGPTLTKKLTIGGNDYTIGTINRPMYFGTSADKQNGLAIYNHYYKSTMTTTDLGDVNVLCELPNGKLTPGTHSLRVVQQVPNNVDFGEIPYGQILITIHGTNSYNNIFQNLKAEDSVSLTMSLTQTGFDSVTNILGSMYTPLTNNEVKNYDSGTASLKDCRMSFGIKADGSMVMFFLGDENNRNANGVSITELGQIMKDLGCVSAVNLDAGGSASLMVKKSGQSTVEPAHPYIDGSARLVANALFLCKAKTTSEMPISNVDSVNFDEFEAKGIFTWLGLNDERINELEVKILTSEGNAIEGINAISLAKDATRFVTPILTKGTYKLQILSKTDLGDGTLFETPFVISTNVPDHAPIIAKSIGEITTNVNQPVSLDLSSVFTDADGDTIVITPDKGTVTGTTYENTFTTRGSNSVVLTATANGKSVSHTFNVYVAGGAIETFEDSNLNGWTFEANANQNATTIRGISNNPKPEINNSSLKSLENTLNLSVAGYPFLYKDYEALSDKITFSTNFYSADMSSIDFGIRFFKGNGTGNGTNWLNGLIINKGKLQWDVYSGGTKDSILGTTWGKFTSEKTLDPSKWYTVRLNMDITAGTVEIYIDGEIVSFTNIYKDKAGDPYAGAETITNPPLALKGQEATYSGIFKRVGFRNNATAANVTRSTFVDNILVECERSFADEVTGHSAVAADSSAVVNFTDSANLEKVKITTYQGENPVGTPVIVNKGVGSATISSLTNGTAYKFKIQAIDKYSNESVGVFTNEVTPASGMSIANKATNLNVDYKNDSSESYVLTFDSDESGATYKAIVTPTGGEAQEITGDSTKSIDLSALASTTFEASIVVETTVSGKTSSSSNAITYNFGYGGGTGEVATPYLIYNERHLKSINTNASNLALNYKQMNNIVVTDTLFVPIGYINGLETLSFFSGSYIGDGSTHKTITFNIDRSNATPDYGRSGMFAALSGTASIKNIGIEGSMKYKNTAQYVGAFAGGTGSGTEMIVENCYNKSNLTGGSFVGGIVGVGAANLTMKNCYNTGNISGSTSVAGICANPYSTVVDSCYNTGNIVAENLTTASAGTRAGGISASQGKAANAVTITNCFNTGNVTSYNYAGGIIGQNFSASNATISNCYNIGEITTTLTNKYEIAEAANAALTNVYYINDGSCAITTGAIEIPQNLRNHLEKYTNFPTDIWQLGQNSSYDMPELKFNLYVGPANNKTTDTTAPSDVTNLSAIADNSKILVSFTPGEEEDLKEIKIYLDGVLKETLAKTETAYEITGLNNGTQYTVKVTTVDYDGNESVGISITETPLELTETLAKPVVTGISYDEDAITGDEKYNLTVENISTATIYRAYMGLEVVESSTNVIDITPLIKKSDTVTGVVGVTVKAFNASEFSPASDLYETTTLNVLYAGGTGTELDPFIIRSARHLSNVTYNNTSHFLQTKDLTGNLEKPIPTFSGTYRGDGATQKEIKLNIILSTSGASSSANQTQNAALFGTLEVGAVVENIKTIGVVTTDNSAGAAGIAGATVGDVTLRNCSNEANITKTIQFTGYQATGGIVGYQKAGTNVILENLVNRGTISGASNTGGIIGYNGNIVSNAKNYGTILGSSSVGGILGAGYGNVEKSANFGNVGKSDNTSTAVAGIAGILSGMSLTECYNKGEIVGKEWVGGLVGKAAGSTGAINIVKNSYNAGTIIAEITTRSSGLVGGLGYSNTSINKNRYNYIKMDNCYDASNSNKDVLGELLTYSSVETDIIKPGGTGGSYIKNSYYVADASITNAYATNKTIAELQNLLADDTTFDVGIWEIAAGYDYPQLINNPHE